MKIVIAPDSYKGSASALEVSDAIEKGIRKVYKKARITKLPVADGGEGTVEALVTSKNGRYEKVQVLGPLGNIISSRYGVLDDKTAVIGMSEASGLTLVSKEKLNPLVTTTYGTGQLIKEAMEKGARKIYVGLGGSATNDGGVGMAQALGVSFKDELGKEIGYGGLELGRICEIDFTDIHPLLEVTEIIAISDVQNPLCGKNGASHVFGPQKGATKEDVLILDNNLKHYAEKVKEYIGIEISNVPGSGAAGGLGGGLIAFCNARIDSGIDMVLDIINIDKHLIDTDLVITGEGKIDGQSAYGKAPIGVAKRAKKYNIPVIAIVGSVGSGADKVYSHGIDIIVDIIDKPITLGDAMENVTDLIMKAAANATRIAKFKGIHNVSKGAHEFKKIE